MKIENIKVGNLVKIKEDIEVMQIFGNVFVTDDIYDKRGSVLRVSNIEDGVFNVVELGNKTWFDPELVLTIIGEKVVCHKCGKELDSENAKFDCLGHPYCEDCIDEVFTTCSVCGKEIDKNSSNYCMFNGVVYCKECFGSKFKTCKICGEIHPVDDMYKVKDGYACKTCIDDKYVKCELCGEYHLKSEMTKINGVKYCDDCLRERAQDTIKSYHHYCDWTVHNTSNDGLYNNIPMGFELEIERTSKVKSKMTNDLAAYIAIHKSDNLVVCERDGSLDDGFEIISHPFTMQWMYNEGEETIVDMVTFLNDNKFTDERPTSGLHIHVDRNSLETAQRTQEEVIDNISLILETFKEEVMHFARRESNGYCRFLTDMQDNINLSYVKKKKRDQRGERYLVLNENNSNTIEFRIFQSTLNPSTLMATFEFVNNIVNIAKHKDIDGLKWSDIINYNSSTTRFIKDYNEAMNIKSSKKITVLSNFEKNKDKYTLKTFLNGDFAINLDRRDASYKYLLIGILATTSVTVHSNYSNLRDCLNRKYDECESVHVKEFSGVKRLISVNSTHKNSDIVSLTDIIDLWMENRSLLA